MKKYFLVGFAFISSIAAIGQNIIEIPAGAQLVCNGSPLITLSDFNQFKNNGTFVAGNGKFVIKSSSISTTIGVNGGTAITFYDLSVDNTQNVQLAHSIGIADTIYFVSGNLNLKNNSINFSSTGGIKNETETARVMDDPANAGQLIITQNLAQSPNSNPANLGVEIMTTAAAPGATTITRYCGVVVHNGISSGLIQRYYRIEPSVNNSLNATAKFYYLNAELNGVDPASAVLWKSINNGITWSLINPDARDINAKWLQKNNINDFSLWTIGSVNSALPVIFNSFNTVCKNDGAYLQWSTGFELNSDYFIVEKSIDGITWTELVRINAAGTASAYNFTDHFAGAAYYRLKQVDKDGQFKYSRIIRSVCAITSISVLLYPNPAKAFTDLEFDSPGEFRSEIMIYDGIGKLIRKIPVEVQRGQQVIRINLGGLASGSYLIILKEKSLDISKKLIVQ